MKTHAIAPVAFAKHALVAAAFLTAANLSAQIAVNLGPGPVINFSNTPPATEWATRDTLVGSSYNSPAELDAGAQTLDAASIATALPITASMSGTSWYARHSTNGGYLFTQPAGVPFAILLAKLQNTSGVEIGLLNVSYDFSVVVPPVTDNVPGQRAYWSQTGASNSWTLIPEFSGLTASAAVSSSLDLGAWAAAANLYILWLDDNNGTGADGAFAIDNVVFTGATSGDITITDDPDSIRVPERSAATFTVAATGLPQAYHWLRDGSPIPGAHNASYTNPSVVYPGDNGAIYSVIVSNSSGIQTSAGAMLTVWPDTNAPVALRVVGDFTRTSLTVSFSEPINPASVDPAQFQIFPSGTDPSLAEILTTDAVLTNATNIVIRMAEAYAADVNHSILLFGIHDTSGGSPGGNLMDPNPSILPVHQRISLIDFDGPNNIWSFSTETNLFGTGWETLGYDDLPWPTGPAGLGRDGSNNGVPIRTAVYPLNDSAPQFFRRHFYLNAQPANSVLSMRHVFEDGAVVYLNGQEAGRVNVGAGILSVTTRAPTFAPDPTPISASLPLPTTNLVAGGNVIAVVVFQYGGTSFDCEMALELTATITEYANTQKLKITASGADVVITWNVAGTLQHSTNLSSPTNWTPVPGSPTSPFTTNASGSGTFYRVAVP